MRSLLSPPERLRASTAMAQVRAMLTNDGSACNTLRSALRQLRDKPRAEPIRMILRRDCGDSR